MKFSWKVLFALVVLVGAVVWGIESLRTRSYSGSDLNFGIGSGTVTVTNSADASVPVQLVGTGTRSFAVTSTTEGIAGSSERQGSGRTATQLFAFDLPPGVTELMIVARGSVVSFVAGVGSRLEATVQPLAEGAARTTTIVVVVAVLGSLFYMSRSTGHHWLNRIRRITPAVPAVVTNAEGGQGRTFRSYGDNVASRRDE